MPDHRSVMIGSTDCDLPEHWKIDVRGDASVEIVGSYN